MTTTTSITCRGLLPALILLSSNTAPGDAILVGDRQSLDNVRITGLRAGALVLRLPDGREAVEDLARIERIAFARWPLFNLAEKQRAAGEFPLAANTYEKALEVLEQQAGAARPVQPADWSREGLALLVHSRLIGVYDRANRFDLAVKSYLDVVEHMPEVTLSLRPAALPPAQSSFLRAAREHVEQAVARSKDSEFREKMHEWLAAWPRFAPATTRPDAEPPDPDGSHSGSDGTDNLPASPGAAFRQALEGVAADIAAHAYAQALSRLDALAGQSPHRPAAWYYWRGRALEGLAPSLGDKEQRDTAISGGLAYLRVVIHFPQDERAPESLFRAGTICGGPGEREQAAAIWRDLLKRWPDTAPWNRLAAEKLERVNAK